MKILKAKVQWMKEYSNNPGFQVLVDHWPSKEIRYIQHGSLWYGECDGAVEFKSYSRPGEGYGGSAWNLTMLDGSVRELKGPWSSSCYAMNGARMFEKFAVAAMEYSFNASGSPCATISWTDDPKAFDRGYTFMGGCAIAVPKLLEAAKIAGVYLVAETIGDGGIYSKELSAEQNLPIHDARLKQMPYENWTSIPRGVDFSFFPSLEQDHIVKEK